MVDEEQDYLKTMYIDLSNAQEADTFSKLEFESTELSEEDKDKLAKRMLEISVRAYKAGYVRGRDGTTTKKQQGGEIL